MEESKNRPVVHVAAKQPYRGENIPRLIGEDGQDLPVRPRMALCRCGETKDSPFCDGSHVDAGFVGAKHPDRLPDRERDYVGREIVIHDNRGVCSHDGACLRLLPQVFRKKERPWIDPDGASVEEIIETIRQCPSGALSYSLGGQRYGEHGREVGIRVVKGGPLEVSGGIALDCQCGSRPACEEHYCLCRCGHTKNSPFCDGGHYR